MSVESAKFFEKLCSLDVQNFEHSLINCVLWTYEIRQILWVSAHRICNFLWKIVDVEHAKDWVLFEKIAFFECTLLCKSFWVIVLVEYAKFFEKLCLMYMKIFEYSTINCVLWMYEIFWIVWVIVLVEYAIYLEILWTLNMWKIECSLKNRVFRTYIVK